MYDALYIALAETLVVALVTVDARVGRGDAGSGRCRHRGDRALIAVTSRGRASSVRRAPR